MQQILFPVKVVKSSGVDDVKNLLSKQDLQIDLYEPILTKFHADSYVILDFGKEMRGGIRVLTYGSDNSRVHVRFGESVGECCAELGKGMNSTNDHAPRDFYVNLPNWSDTPLGDTGFRFVRLDFTGEVKIKSVVCVNQILSRRAKYVYRGGDALVKRIYTAAKRTIDLCASSGYIWDGVKRDRLVWVGDMSPEVLALTALYGRTEEAERSLEFARLHTPLPGWMDRMTTYSLWWMIILKDYLDRTGAEDFVERQMDYLEGLVAQVASFTDDGGNMSYPRYFVDWSHVGTDEEQDGFRAINMMATQAAISLLEHFGRDSAPAKAHMRNLLKREITVKSKVIAALKYWATGALSEEEKEVLLTGGTKGVSTFMSYYILSAIHAYDAQFAMSVMKEYYGGMLKVGSTTFWEEFESEWLEGAAPITRLPKRKEKDVHGAYGKHCYVGFRKSLCHGWAAGVLAYLYEYCENELPTKRHFKTTF